MNPGKADANADAEPIVVVVLLVSSRMVSTK